MRSALARTTGPIQRSNSQRGSRNQNSFTEDYSSHDQENYDLASRGFRNSHLVGKSDNTKPAYGSKTGKIAQKSKKDRDLDNENENELSSLSGFTASDNEEEHEDLKFGLYPKSNKKKAKELTYSDEDDLEHEHKDIMLNPKDDLKARFAQLEMLKKKNEEERKQREILGEQDVDDVQNFPLRRPQSSYGAVRGSENMNNMNNSRTFMSTKQKENLYPVRPQTANVSNMRLTEGEPEKPITFKPVYTKSINQTLMEKKKFNYGDKKFKTLTKKSDPVSRFNAFKSGWNKTKFLKNTGQADNKKEGRKLNLSERNQASKPDFIFHKYQPKYVFDV